MPPNEEPKSDGPENGGRERAEQEGSDPGESVDDVLDEFAPRLHAAVTREKRKTLKEARVVEDHRYTFNRKLVTTEGREDLPAELAEATHETCEVYRALRRFRAEEGTGVRLGQKALYEYMVRADPGRHPSLRTVHRATDDLCAAGVVRKDEAVGLLLTDQTSSLPF